ncbi:MAG: L17 family ribosomal protein [Candidatus Daviesbacteria bacterium]|nr:L17 family ribosomal protein [Candidatus Daviesbacteria bacterium]
MRHRVYGKHLGRNKDQRKLLFKGLIYSLFSHGTIQTSEAKAKAIKGLVDKVISSAKKNPKSIPQDLQELIGRIIPKLGTRTSGFTQVARMGTRLGDQTMMVRMSLIGNEELKPLEKGSTVATKKTVRVKSKLSKTK